MLLLEEALFLNDGWMEHTSSSRHVKHNCMKKETTISHRIFMCRDTSVRVFVFFRHGCKLQLNEMKTKSLRHDFEVRSRASLFGLITLRSSALEARSTKHPDC